MRRAFLLSLFIAVLSAVVSCSPPLPKAYGVYARDGRALIDLTDKDVSDDWDLPDDIAIVVFEREISEQGFTPARDLTLHQTAYVRSEQIHELRADAREALNFINRDPGSVAIAEVASLPIQREGSVYKDAWIPIGGQISVRYEPVADRRDIVILVPEAPLPEGTYAITRLSPSGPRQVSFAVNLSADLQHRKDATCVDEHLYTVRRPEGFQGWGQWFTDFSNVDRARSRRTADGSPVLAASTKPCSVLDEAAKRRMRIPSYIQGMESLVLTSWLSYNPTFRPLEAKDCDCNEDLVAMRQYWENSEPYYVKADFNGDGNQDFAVVLLDTQSNHKWGWNAALAVFNGPLHKGMPPTFLEKQAGSLHGALLYHNSEVPLLIGPFESEGALLKPKGDTYELE